MRNAFYAEFEFLPFPDYQVILSLASKSQSPCFVSGDQDLLLQHKDAL